MSITVERWCLNQINPTGKIERVLINSLVVIILIMGFLY